jgi:hypothetical protein
MLRTTRAIAIALSTTVIFATSPPLITTSAIAAAFHWEWRGGKWIKVVTHRPPSLPAERRKGLTPR